VPRALREKEATGVQRILRYLDLGLYWLVCAMVVTLVAVGFATVVFRYLLHSSIFWGDEFLRYLSIWLVFLGSALATRHRALITVDIFTQPLSHRLRESVAAAVAALSTLFLLALAYFSLALVRGSVGTISASLGIPMENMYLVFPVGLGLMAVNMLREAVAHAAAAAGPPPTSDEPQPDVPDRLLHPE
jgi:TRAP-type C4-dicarboxylate transport system permease small subunit